jgi:CheY-like chemotaxis protein
VSVTAVRCRRLSQTMLQRLARHARTAPLQAVVPDGSEMGATANWCSFTVAPAPLTIRTASRTLGPRCWSLRRARSCTRPVQCHQTQKGVTDALRAGDAGDHELERTVADPVANAGKVSGVPPSAGCEQRLALGDSWVASPSAEDALTRLAELLAQGSRVPLILADQWMPGVTGIEFLARATELDPTARRGLLISWGDPSTAAPILEAVALGQIEFYVPKPAWSPDEQFHGPSPSRWSSGGASRVGGSKRSP